MENEAALPAAGEVAPPFELPSSTGHLISLKDLIAEGPAVVYFYPKADTPGCTTQACGFRDAASDYRKAKVAVVGISPDPVAKVTKFADKFTLGFPLLADADHAVAERYGVLGEKSMYGRKYMGVARTTFVIGRNAKVLHVFEKVKPAGHEQAVLEWIRANA